MRELVETLDARGIDWAIATSSRKEQVATSVAALGLMQEPRIVDASHVEHAKPEPDLLLEAAEQLEVEPAHCWYVGDATWDMVAAVAAGMVPIAVTAGSAVDEAALHGAGAAAVVADLSELVDALGLTPRERAQLFFFDFGLLAIFSSSFSLIPVWVFLPSRLRWSSAPMNLRCFSVLAGMWPSFSPRQPR